MPAQEDLIVFDGTCIICSAFARFMLRRDGGRFRFVTAQSDVGRALYRTYALDPDLMETNIVIVAGQAHTKLRAFAAAMGALGGPWALLRHLKVIPQAPSDWIYDRIARNRFVFGRRQCPMPSAELKARLID